MVNLFEQRKKQCRACEIGMVGQTKQCSACANDLVDQLKDAKDEEYWECKCKVWECECKEINYFFCPLCNNYFPESEYLRTVINNANTIWLANMVTHYRHKHIISWNNHWNGTYKGSKYFLYGETYEKEKRKVNERAKRQILRKAETFLKEHGFSLKDFEQLQGNAPKTLALALKTLGK